MTHIPVLQKEVIEYLMPRPNENFIDATVGEAGITTAILKRNGPQGKVLGIELDSELYQELKTQMISERLILVNDSYIKLEEIVKKYNFKQVCGILFDLGLSSFHFEKSGRGFSFKKDEVLDMRYDIRNQEYLTAERIVNGYPESEIEKILKTYGGERFSRRIARKIVEIRKKTPIRTTSQLVKIILTATPHKIYQGRKIHPATRTFQALRIAVNRELENLEKTLPQTLEVLAKEGRLVVISFHSGEDKIVKNFLKENEKKGLLRILTKKPITPSLEELEKNPRARSAKLRAAQKS